MPNGSSASLGKRKRGAAAATSASEEPKDLGKESVGKEEELARQLGVPVEEVPAMLEDDRAESDIDDEMEGTEGMERPGTLYKMGTIDAYCAAIAELYETQRTNSSNSHPTFRGPAFKGLIESRRRAQDHQHRSVPECRARRRRWRQHPRRRR